MCVPTVCRASPAPTVRGVQSRPYDALVVDAGGVLIGARDGRSLLDVVAAVRAAGLRTALLTNADRDAEVPDGWRPVFDVVVVSGEVGMRKPEPRIYRLTADRLGVPAERCVFVDDLAVNVRGAVAAGMTGVHHAGRDRTVTELAVLLEMPLSPGVPGC